MAARRAPRRSRRPRAGVLAVARYATALDALVTLLDAPGPRPDPEAAAAAFCQHLRGSEQLRKAPTPAARLQDVAGALDRVGAELAALECEAPEGEAPPTASAAQWIHLVDEIARSLPVTGAGFGAALVARVGELRGMPPVRAELQYGVACCAALAASLRALGTARTDICPGVH